MLTNEHSVFSLCGYLTQTKQTILIYIIYKIMFYHFSQALQWY